MKLTISPDAVMVDGELFVRPGSAYVLALKQCPLCGSENLRTHKHDDMTAQRACLDCDRYLNKMTAEDDR